jgi:hypothetical protein
MILKNVRRSLTGTLLHMNLGWQYTGPVDLQAVEKTRQPTLGSWVRWWVMDLIGDGM